MEIISGPAESLSSEFRLQQKRLMREIDAIAETLSGLAVASCAASGNATSSSISLATETVSTIDSLEAKLDYLIAKEKETSLRVKLFCIQTIL